MDRDAPTDDAFEAFRPFGFPTIEWTKLEMRDLARERGFLSILERSRSCSARRGATAARAGSARLCTDARHQGMAWRLPRVARLRGRRRGGRARRVGEARLTEAARPRQPLNALPGPCGRPARHRTPGDAAPDHGARGARPRRTTSPRDRGGRSSGPRPRPSGRPGSPRTLSCTSSTAQVPSGRSSRSIAPHVNTQRSATSWPASSTCTPGRRPIAPAAAGVLPVPLREGLRVGEPDVAQPDDPVLSSLGHERLHGQGAGARVSAARRWNRPVRKVRANARAAATSFTCSTPLPPAPAPCLHH